MVLIALLVFSLVSVSASDIDNLNVQENGLDNDNSLTVDEDSSISDSDSELSSSTSDLEDMVSSADSNSSDNVMSSSSSDSGSALSSSASSSSSMPIASSEDDSNGIETSQDEILSSSSSDSALKSSSTVSPVYKSTFVSRNVECNSMKTKYTIGSITYKIKPYDIVQINGSNYISPLYYSKINFRVYTGSGFKNYYAYVDEKGIASVKIPKLSAGVHKIAFYFNDKMIGSSSITVTKSKATVYAPKKTVKNNTKSYFYIKVSDRLGFLAKNVKLKVKVYTGKKAKTFTVKTNSKGVAKIKTNKLDLGSHKVLIKSSNKNLKIKKYSKIIVKESVAKKALKLNASFPVSTVKYKSNTYFKIKVTDYFGFTKKKLKIKVKVYTGKKAKTYNLKTNSKGIAKIKINKLAIGSHKVVVKSRNKNYKLSKSTKLIVKKSLATANTSLAPNLVSIEFYQRSNNYYSSLQWYAKKGSTYQILRKLNGNYDILANVKANESEMSFYDKISKDKLYTYSVREITVQDSQKVLGPYDSEGLKLIDRPKVNVDFQNLKANVHWTKQAGATKYRVFRKIGRDGKYKCIATVDAKNLNYTDYYYKSTNDLEELITASVFIDPSYNSLFYTVRACNQKTVNSVKKTSYGLYYLDGDFHLEAPSIVSLKDNVLKWGKVPNAEGYLILKKDSGSSTWEKIMDVAAGTSVIQKTNIGVTDNNSFYAVQAYSTKNGEKVYSNYDKGFSLRYFSLENAKQRILYFGDSITHGSPYDSSSTQHVFSIPYRVAQLLGCVYYNPSVPGSTYHDLGQKDGKNIENTNYYRYRITREVVDAIDAGELPANWEFLHTDKNSEGISNTCIEDYNIVVLAAGTNDYIDNTVLGSKNSQDTSTFNGALNHILEKIENASKKRVERGEEAIKVVFVDLYYSDRTYINKYVNNRDITPNKIGLLLTDYQQALDEQLIKWQDKSEYLSFYNFLTRDYNIVNEDTCPYASTDNLHFTKFTYGQYGNAFAQFLLDEVF